MSSDPLMTRISLVSPRIVPVSRCYQSIFVVTLSSGSDFVYCMYNSLSHHVRSVAYDSLELLLHQPGTSSTPSHQLTHRSSALGPSTSLARDFGAPRRHLHCILEDVLNILIPQFVQPIHILRSPLLLEHLLHSRRSASYSGM